MAQQADMVQRQGSEPEATRQQSPGTLRAIPPVDVYENDQEILVIADMPGVSPDDVEIRLDGAELFVSGAQKAPGDDAERPALLEFQRRFTIPEVIEPDAVTAELKHGVLHLKLGKSEKAKPRRIAVTAG